MITQYPDGTDAEEIKQFNWQTGAPVARAENENYRTTETCDGCKKRALGVMLHAAGATGRVCPVLFLCDACRAPVDAQAAA